ncbi:MAG: ribonuclease P protein component [Bacillota bacterium]|nr:ribonuclease P protein component [Bacillota bacterium]
MLFTESLTENRNFTRLYKAGKSAAGPFAAVYCRKNRLCYNRLGITVSVKIGGAVKRNRIRRLIREAYRLNETSLKTGFDIVIVARRRSSDASFSDMEQSVLKAFKALKVMREE